MLYHGHGTELAGVASPEAPHIYHIGKYYYLLNAEGGTEESENRALFAWAEYEDL